MAIYALLDPQNYQQIHFIFLRTITRQTKDSFHMACRKTHTLLGDSWVVEGEDDENYSHDEAAERQDDVVVQEPSFKLQSTGLRVTKEDTRSPEPEFIMPSLDASTMDGSWADTSREPHPQRSPQRQKLRTPEQHAEPRRRSTRQAALSGSPQKRALFRQISRPKPPVETHGPELLEAVIDHAAAMLLWTLEVLGKSLRILKTPISYALAVWIAVGLSVVLRTLITTSIYASLSPICRIPGTSYLSLPFCPSIAYDSGAAASVEFDQLMNVQSKLEEVLEETAGGVSLPMDMKRGETSIRDLRQLVRYSVLDSKNELVLEFDGFIENARIASYDLQKFNSHIGRAVDHVVATTHWTTRVLEGIQMHDASEGVINSFASKLLAPFQPVKAKFTESALLDQYIKHTEIIEEEIRKLIDEAQALLMVLNSLEDRLEVIHGIVTRDGIHANAQREEILSELWTMVGGNKGKLTKTQRQLALLGQVGMYRKSAYGHVAGTILKLQQIGAGLEDLRERVATPELLRDRVDIPLSVHIENIQRGVERLEEGRQNARKTENEHIAKTLEKGRVEGTLIGVD